MKTNPLRKLMDAFGIHPIIINAFKKTLSSLNWDKFLPEFQTAILGALFSGMLAYNLEFGVVLFVLITYLGALIFFCLALVEAFFAKE